MDEFEDELDRLAAAGLSRRQSTVGFPMKSTSYHSGLGHMRVTTACGENSHENEARVEKEVYRVLVLGATRVGKTSIIAQFLYDHFKTTHKATVEEMYKVTFDVGDTKVTFLNEKKPHSTEVLLKFVRLSWQSQKL